MTHPDKEIPEGTRAMVITVSDTRTPDTDASGDLIAGSLEAAGVEVAARTIIPDDRERIGFAVQQNLEAVDVIIITGGTGVSARDVTLDALDFDRVLPGFGELFRYLSYKEIGARAMTSRAALGIKQGVLVFCLPGSESAVRLAMEELILPELGHMLWELHR